jgi:hypothetical protein
VCVLSVKGEKSRTTKREELCGVCFEREGREESGLIPSVRKRNGGNGLRN